PALRTWLYTLWWYITTGGKPGMLFNSYEFIFLFLPLSLASYFLLLRFQSARPALAVLTAASLVFYGWWNPQYVWLLLISVAFNYLCGRLLSASRISKARMRKALLIAGIGGNLILLGYYKYAAFLAETLAGI